MAKMSHQELSLPIEMDEFRAVLKEIVLARAKPTQRFVQLLGRGERFKERASRKRFEWLGALTVMPLKSFDLCSIYFFLNMP